MSSTKTDICNMALATIGVNARIGDVDTEKSNEAIQCRLWFDHLRVLLLETRFWPDFAGKRVVLIDLGTPPTHWLFRYKYPTDCRLAVRIINPYTRTPGRGGKIPFKVMKTSDSYGKAILCDEAEAELEYNEDVTDTTLFSASFVQTLAMALAAHIAMPLRVSPGIVSNAQNQFNGWLAEASTHVEREQQEDQEADSELVTVRS